MLILQHLTYIHPNKDILFQNLSLSIAEHSKVALIGNNGTGKSTLLKIIADELMPSEGTVSVYPLPYYVPQHFGQYDSLTVAEALLVGDKLRALAAILEGEASAHNLNVLNDDWLIEEKCLQALDRWQLQGVNLYQSMGKLSGGQKTKVFLAGIDIHQPEMVLLDEPGNHLDRDGKQLLLNFIDSWQKSLLVVSHDRVLLNHLNTIAVLNQQGITLYGGNYDFYLEQRDLELTALQEELRNKEKALRKAKDAERDAAERQQKLDSRGRKKQEKSGLPKIMMNTFRNSAENSTARQKAVHAEKTGGIAQELSDLRNTVPAPDKIKIGFDHSRLHQGKIFIMADNINFGYADKPLWNKPISIRIVSGQRISVTGKNGSGKSSLMKLILGDVEPKSGHIERKYNQAIYIDQDYSLIRGSTTVYEKVCSFNESGLQEHELKIRLNRFLFSKTYWDMPCDTLSGGEKMRLMLCCFTIQQQSPDMIVLDEPTNNLDIGNVEILTNAINEYRGTLLVVSHEQSFLDQIGISESIELL
jgi:ATPase subunit of ABC transporter with duplicated ATPase domains